MRIGIDVGGTHTDAVIMDGAEVVGSTKALTTSDILSGIRAALDEVLRQTGAAPSAIECVMVGTTQFTNAVVTRSGLARTAAVRVCLPTGSAVPPMADWPPDLRSQMDGGAHLLHGGHEYNGRPIAPLDANEVSRAIESIDTSGVRALAVTGVFSPLTPDVEDEIAARLHDSIDGLDVTRSHELGRLGLLERENAALLNAGLKPLARHVIGAMRAALDRAGIAAPVYISQNDGTLIEAAAAQEHPVRTFSSGPTNSMRGAAWLSDVDRAIVIDVGGTTADVGMLIDGFPRPSGTTVEVGGVRLNFGMPDVLSIGLGGGSVVRESGARVGPDSVGHELVERALVFGGDTLTATDIGVGAGLARIGDRALPDLETGVLDAAQQRIRALLADAVDRIKTSPAPLPLIAVGGGAFLVPDDLPGISRVARPQHAGVANAIGAALAQVSGEAELLYAAGADTRDAALASARQQATQRVIAAGARPGTVEIVDVEEVSLAYMAESTTRLRVKVVGDLDLGEIAARGV